MGTSRCRSLPAHAAAAALALVPWGFLPLFRDALLLPKLILAAAAVVVGTLGWAASGAPSLAMGLEAPLLACAAAAALAGAASIDLPSSLYGPDLVPEVSLAGAALVVASLYLGVAASRLDEEAPARLAKVFCASALPMTALAAVQAWVPLPADFLFAGPLGRAMGTFGHPVALGAYFAAVLPVAFWLALERRSRPWSVAAGAFLVGRAATASRAGMLGGAAGCAWVLYARAGRPWGRGVLLAVLVALGGAGTLAMKLDAGRGGARLGALAVAGQAFKEHPLVGWGPGTFSFLYRRLRTAADAEREGWGVSMPHAHNDWAEAAVAGGLTGLAAYAWLNAALGISLGGLAPAAGVVVSLFVFSKFTLPALPILAMAAALLGSALGAAPPRPGPAPARLAALLCVGSAAWGGWAVLRRVPGDRYAQLGREARSAGQAREAALSFERAVAASPDSLPFRQDLANLLWDAADSAATPSRSDILDRARDVALEGVRRRPAESEFLRLLG
ncbi:MAG: O-antigen ligase family protein [Elusimicrobia bacterium]|nr:O-antigen ligase family protein [Elusimicrobiota bacterium]